MRFLPLPVLSKIRHCTFLRGDFLFSKRSIRMPEVQSWVVLLFVVRLELDLERRVRYI